MRNTLVLVGQGKLRPFFQKKFGDFSVLFGCFPWHWPHVGVAVDTLTKIADPFEVVIQQLAEFLEVQLLDVKRVLDL